MYLILKATDDPCVDYADEVVSLTYYSYSLGVFGIVKGIKPLTIESAEKQYKKPIILRQPVPTNLDMIKTPEYVDAIPHNAVCVRATGWADSTEFTHRIESFIYPDKEVSDQQHYVIPMESFYAKIKKLDTDKKQDFKEYFDKRWEVAQKWHIS